MVSPVYFFLVVRDVFVGKSEIFYGSESDTHYGRLRFILNYLFIFYEKKCFFFSLIEVLYGFFQLLFLSFDEIKGRGAHSEVTHEEF